MRQVDRQVKEDAYRSFCGHVPVGDEDVGSGCVGSAEGDVDAGLGSESQSPTGVLEKCMGMMLGFCSGIRGQIA